jgi:DNA-binding NarL/FixJ family response regulator
VKLDNDRDDTCADVVIIDDEKILCDLLRRRLDDEPGLTCIGTAGTSDDALVLVEQRQPDVILVDVKLGKADGIALVGNLVALSPSSQVLVWTRWTDPDANRREEIRHRSRAGKAGATDWIPKGDGLDNLISRIRAAASRGPLRPVEEELLNPLEEALAHLLGNEGVLDVPDDFPSVDRLTPTEERAAKATARGLETGMKVEEIAKVLSMKTETLRTHIRKIYVKWGVHGQPQFVAEAKRRGLC